MSLQDIALQIGPESAPYVKATGNLNDLLQLNGIDFDGALEAPATLILPPEDFENADAFGRVEAEFSITDADRRDVDELIRRVEATLSEAEPERRNIILAALAELSARYMLPAAEREAEAKSEERAIS